MIMTIMIVVVISKEEEEENEKEAGQNNIFTARRVCIVRSMPWQDVCPSVCLSNAGIVCKCLYISSKVFSPCGSPIILVFFTPNGKAIVRRGLP